MGDYRTRIYGSYVEARREELAPANLRDIEPRAHLLRAIIRRDFPPNRKAVILDLGCGYGAVHCIREADYENIAGVDVSPPQVAAAARLGIGGVREGDLLETLRSLPDSSHDVILLFDVLGYFTKEETIDSVDSAPPS